MPEYKGKGLPKPGDIIFSQEENNARLVGSDLEETKREIEAETEKARARRAEIIVWMKKDTSSFPKDIVLAAETLETDTAFPMGHIVTKLENALALRNRLQQEGIVQKEKMKYIGSGLDIQYPLLLGGRNIILVDSIFQEDQHLPDLLERIKKYDPEAQLTKEESNSTIHFLFDFGKGKEQVAIQVVPQSFQSLPKQEPIGVLITYCLGPNNIFYYPKLLKSVVERGYILTNEYSSPIYSIAFSNIRRQFPDSAEGDEAFSSRLPQQLDTEIANVASTFGLERLMPRKEQAECYKIIDKKKFEESLTGVKPENLWQG